MPPKRSTRSKQAAEAVAKEEEAQEDVLAPVEDDDVAVAADTAANAADAIPESDAEVNKEEEGDVDGEDVKDGAANPDAEQQAAAAAIAARLVKKHQEDAEVDQNGAAEGAAGDGEREGGNGSKRPREDDVAGLEGPDRKKSGSVSAEMAAGIPGSGPGVEAQVAMEPPDQVALGIPVKQAIEHE